MMKALMNKDILGEIGERVGLENTAMLACVSPEIIRMVHNDEDFWKRIVRTTNEKWTLAPHNDTHDVRRAMDLELDALRIERAVSNPADLSRRAHKTMRVEWYNAILEQRTGFPSRMLGLTQHLDVLGGCVSSHMVLIEDTVLMDDDNDKHGRQLLKTCISAMRSSGVPLPGSQKRKRGAYYCHGGGGENATRNNMYSKKQHNYYLDRDDARHRAMCESCGESTTIRSTSAVEWNNGIVAVVAHSHNSGGASARGLLFESELTISPDTGVVWTLSHEALKSSVNATHDPESHKWTFKYLGGEGSNTMDSNLARIADAHCLTSRNQVLASIFWMTCPAFRGKLELAMRMLKKDNE